MVSTDTKGLKVEGGALLLAREDESPSSLPSGDIRVPCYSLMRVEVLAPHLAFVGMGGSGATVFSVVFC